MNAKIIAALLGAGAACAAGIMLAGNYFYDYALTPKRDRKPGRGVRFDPGEENPDAAAWKAEAEPKDVYIDSFDALRLHALVDDRKSDRFVICCHGYTADASAEFPTAAKFARMGYGVLLPDARGHGASGGTYIGMGWHERHDVLSWIEYLNETYDDPQIVLYGISMGAATVMMASGEDLPDNVKAVVEDCGYSSIAAQFAHNLKQMYKLPAFPVLNAAGIVSMRKAGYNVAKDGDVTKQLERSKTPTLFIHGDADDFVPFEMVYEVYGACAAEKELEVFPGAKHGLSEASDPERYWKVIGNFLSKYVK